MDHSRVIKGQTLRQELPPALSALPDLHRMRRIPAAAVNVETRPGRPEETVPQARVVRAGQARLSPIPVAIEAQVFVEAPSFALPEPPPPDEPESEPAPVDLEQLRATWEAEWQARLETEVAAARAAAFEAGRMDTLVAMQASYEERLATYADDVRHLATMWEEHLRESEPLLAELAFSVAQAVLDGPLPPGIKGVAARSIIEAVERLRESPSIEIRLHPVDLLRLQENGVVEQIDSLNAGVRWEPTSDLTQGEWIVQSPEAVVRRIEAELIDTLRHRVGLATGSAAGKFHASAGTP